MKKALPTKILLHVEVPPEAFRLAMRGRFMDSLAMVFDYDNLELFEVGIQDGDLVGTFSTERGDYLLPLRREFFGDALHRLADTIKNNM